MTTVVGEAPIEAVLRQLQTVKEKLIPFWGNGRARMEFEPDGAGNVAGIFVYQVPDGESFSRNFHTTPEMATAASSKSTEVRNLLLEYIASTFRELMLSLPREILMKDPFAQHLTEEELAAQS